MKAPVTRRQGTHPTRVLCVDDSADMVQVMQLMIDADPTMQCVGCLTSADHLIQEVRALTPPPDVVLLDATMPGKDPLVAMKKLAADFPAIRTIVYSGHNDPAFLDRVKTAGAWGCVSKSQEPDALLRAVRDVAAGKTLWSQASKKP